MIVVYYMCNNKGVCMENAIVNFCGNVGGFAGDVVYHVQCLALNVKILVQIILIQHGINV
jgi:hypothetical protein